MTKEEFMRNDDWGTNDGSCNRSRGAGDVRVKLLKGGYNSNGERKSLAFRFIDGAEAKITNGHYANFRIFGKKIYFRSEPEGMGYKLSRHKDKGPNCEMKCSVNNPEKWEPFVGCYNLLFDRTFELYYIEMEKKL